MTDEPKPSPAKQKPSGKPKPEGKQTGSTDVALFVSTVLEIQRGMGEQMHTLETLSKNADQSHKDFEEMRRLVNKISHTVYAAGALLTVLGGVAAWLIEKIWTVLLPYLQAKGHV